MTEGGPFDAGFPPSPTTQRREPWRAAKPLNQQIQHLNDAFLSGWLGLWDWGFWLFLAANEPATRGPRCIVRREVSSRPSCSGAAALRAGFPAAGDRLRGFTSTTWQAQRLGDHMLAEPAYSVSSPARCERVLWRTDGPVYSWVRLKSDTQPALGD